MASELVIGPGVTLEYCQLLAEEIPFSRFEEVYTGEIGIGDTFFKMRVGLHLRQPKQAIIAHGQFIKMRTEDRFGKNLRVLDPRNPDLCLYNNGCWCPDISKTDHAFFEERDSIIFDYAPTVNALLRKKRK